MPHATGPADLIVDNANVITVDPEVPQARAVAVRDGRIVAVAEQGSLDELAGVGTKRLDARRRALVPGFVDTHAHLDREGLKYQLPSLAGVKSIADVLERVRAEVGKRRPGEWVVMMPIGDPPYYWNVPGILAENRFPTRQELDSVSPDNPVYVKGIWGPWNEPPIISIANSRALALAAITRDTLPPWSGVTIEKDENGDPNGVIVEASNYPTVEHSLMRCVPRFTLEDRARGLRESMRRYNAAGTTSIYEGHGLAPEVLRAYKTVHDRGEATVRSYLVLSPTWKTLYEAEITMRDWIHYASGPGFGDDLLRIGGVFLQLGGNPQVTRVLEQALPFTGWAGFAEHATTYEEYFALARLAARHNLRVNSITTAHPADVLRAWTEIDAETPLHGRRWVAVHLRTISPDQVETMRRLGIHAASIPATHLWKGGRQLLDQPEIGEWSAPYRRLTDAGITWSIGTDNKPYQPLFSLWSALSRTERETGRIVGPGQRPDRLEALRALTLAGAELCFEERHKGSITPGKLADFILLDGDPLTCPLEEIPNLSVDLTLLGGEIVHQAMDI
ncbi:MAG: amidohydrolase [Chloroflexi bacterium]|nr:amidohydrolase [Chloroflexota bacterium]